MKRNTYAVIAGALPVGLSLNSTSGEIGGTPAMSGVSIFTIQTTDSDLTVTYQRYRAIISHDSTMRQTCMVTEI